MKQDYLKSILRYEKNTGQFVWLVKRIGCELGSVAGHVNHKSGYRFIGIDGKTYLAHRLAWFYIHGEWPENDIDHRDLNRDHNWLSNLRTATRAENKRNQGAHRDNRSGLKGVTWDSFIGKWKAQLNFNKRKINLGRFKTAQEASAAYEKKASELFSEFYREVSA